MYVISRISALTMPIRDQKTEYTPQGDVRRVIPAVSVQFHRYGGAPDWAREAVSRLPGFGTGLGENEDPFLRVGILDTVEEQQRQGWDEETLEFVEKAMRDSASNGIEYVICEAPKVARPWDKYDDFDGHDAVEKILYTIDLIGADAPSVLRYEKENAQRPEVIAALETLVEKDEEDVVGVISV